MGSVSASTYYVDSIGGNDGNNGLSTSQAWLTIGKINNTVFSIGDSILLNRTGVWNNQMLYPKNNSINIGAYGSGSNPLLDGQNNTASNTGVMILSRSNFTISNIDVTRWTQFGFSIDGHEITINNCSSSLAGNDNLVITSADNPAYNIIVNGGNFSKGYDYDMSGAAITGIEIADGAHDITIDGVHAYDNTGTYGRGISIHNHEGTSLPYNITISNSNFSGNFDAGVSINKREKTANTIANITLDNITTINNIGYGVSIVGGNYVNTTSNITISNSQIYDNGVAPEIYLRYLNNFTFLRNVVAGGASCPSATLIEATNLTNANFYHNTLYEKCKTTTLYDIVFYNTGTQNINIKNNLFDGNKDAMMWFTAGSNNSISSDYNLFNYTGNDNKWRWNGISIPYLTWQGFGNDPHSIRNQTQYYINPSVNDFRIQQTSPTFDTGTNLGYPYCGASPDIGYYENCTTPTHAQFTPTNTTIYHPTIIMFTDTSDGSPSSWNWKFKDVTGNNTWITFNQTQNPQVVFGDGNYLIQLNASNPNGYNISTQTTFVNITNVLPTYGGLGQTGYGSGGGGAGYLGNPGTGAVGLLHIEYTSYTDPVLRDEGKSPLIDSRNSIISTFTIGVLLCKIIVIVSIASLIFIALMKTGLIPNLKE